MYIILLYIYSVVWSRPGNLALEKNHNNTILINNVKIDHVIFEYIRYKHTFIHLCINGFGILKSLLFLWPIKTKRFSREKCNFSSAHTNVSLHSHTLT